jgi:signal peptidase II
MEALESPALPVTHEIPVQRRLILFAWLAPLVVALDHVTKLMAVAQLRFSPRLSYLGDLLRLQYSENAGAFLGLGAELQPRVRFWLLTVAVGALLVGILALLFTRDGVTRGEAVGLTLIGAGGFSNWIDRLLNEGVVIDFLNLGVGGLRTGIFNVADMAITGGVLFLAVLSLTGRRTEQHSDPDERGAEGVLGGDSGDP